MTEKVSWLITGASRGIGLELVRQLLSDPANIVIATCRNPSSATALNALASDLVNKGSLHIAQLDITDEDSIQGISSSVQDILGDGGLDYLLNNAAINVGDDIGFTLTSRALENSFRANVTGPALIAQALLPFIEKSNRKLIMNMSSGLASIGIDLGPKNASYSISKTALNMLTYKQAKIRPDLIVVCVDPGWVKTDMGGQGAFLEPHESVSQIIKVLTSRKQEHSGGFFRYDGETVPW
ncbi:C-factor [Abortiporus biennis]|nr:C-factor [Abortiporus biennis]